MIKIGVGEISYLIFELDGVRYAVDAVTVNEIVWLPELKPIEESPTFIVGVLNLHGSVVAVMDLNIRLRRPVAGYKITDRIVVVQHNMHRIGIIASDLVDVRSITEGIESVPSYGDQYDECEHLVTSLVKIEDEVIMIIDVPKLVRCSVIFDENGETRPEQFAAVSRWVFNQNASAEDLDLLRKRAKSLARIPWSSDNAETMSLAVVLLEGELFGVDLKFVREFTDLSHVTMIPCCPDYVIGDMNLRGDILTIIDIRRLLKLPSSKVFNEAKVIVVHMEDFTIGIPVDDILDMTYITTVNISGIPSALHTVDDEYLLGTAAYDDKMLGILDVRAILLREELIVNEEV